jgi:hypothetical protein
MQQYQTYRAVNKETRIFGSVACLRFLIPLIVGKHKGVKAGG